MKIVLEIAENKAPFVMELLENFSFVKVQPLHIEDGYEADHIKTAFKNASLIKQNKLETRPVKDLLDEL